MAAILRYFTEFSRFGASKLKWFKLDLSAIRMWARELAIHEIIS